MSFQAETPDASGPTFPTRVEPADMMRLENIRLGQENLQLKERELQHVQEKILQQKKIIALEALQYLRIFETKYGFDPTKEPGRLNADGTVIPAQNKQG